MEELKKCPFCGGEAEIRFSNIFKPYCAIRCKKCGASTLEYSTRGCYENVILQAIQAWNKRVE